LPSLTRKQKTRGEQPSGSALADGDIAPVDLTSTDYARMADLVNLYKSLRWQPLIAEPFGANRRGGVGPASPHRGPAEHADALTLPP
jgi:hypothetical protein